MFEGRAGCALSIAARGDLTARLIASDSAAGFTETLTPSALTPRTLLVACSNTFGIVSENPSPQWPAAGELTGQTEFRAVLGDMTLRWF